MEMFLIGKISVICDHFRVWSRFTYYITKIKKGANYLNYSSVKGATNKIIRSQYETEAIIFVAPFTDKIIRSQYETEAIIWVCI